MFKIMKVSTIILICTITGFFFNTCNIFEAPIRGENVNGFQLITLENPQVVLERVLAENPTRSWGTASNDTHPSPAQVADREWLFNHTELSGSLNRLAFGVSSRRIRLDSLPVPVYRADPNTHPGPGVLPEVGRGIIVDNSFRPWGNIVQDSWDLIDPIEVDPSKGVGPDGRQIVLTAINETNNAGKIAGSEDGITYYFRRVPRDVNFRISADFYVDSFGFTGGRAELNGQEAFGFMARDWIPQHHNLPGNWPGTTPASPAIPSRPGFDKSDDYFGRENPDGIPKSGGANFDLTEVALKDIPWHGVYWNGQGTSLNDGVASSSNMIMVGGVKRGMRVYWRTGVRDPDGEKMPVHDFMSIANADFARFHFLPREMSDYSIYGSGIEGTMARPDFPTAGLTYRLYLEKTNSGFVARIEPPRGVGKGVTKARIPSDGFILEYSDLELPFPDLLCGPTSVERDYYYIGLFAARDAKVTVSNLRYEESPADMCPPRVEPEPERIAPTFVVQSAVATSSEDYTLYARSNVEGILMLRFNGGETIALETNDENWIIEPSNASALPFSLFTVPGISLREGDNVFDLVFIPDSKQYRSEFLGFRLDRNGNPVEIPRNEIEFLLSDTRPITRSFMVNRRSLGGADSFPFADNPQDKFPGCVYGPRIQREVIWVAPNGRATGTGSRDNPLDLKTAIAVSSVTPTSGQVIMLKDGIYVPFDPPEMIDGVMRIPIRLTIPRFNSGRANLTRVNPDDPNSPLKYPTPQPRPTSDQPWHPYPDPYADEYYRFYKVLKAENRDRAIIDFRKDLRESGYAPRAMEHRGDFWILDGIHVRNAEDTYVGLRVLGQDNLIRWVKTYFNGDTGMHIGGRADEPKSMWPARNRVEYCESFANVDQARTNADGFAAKLTSWEDIVFYRCIAHHNVDDGWDLFAKKETGPIGPVRIEQSFAYSNGRYLNDEVGRNYSLANNIKRRSHSAEVGGNGFKMGGEGIPIPHIVIHSMTWGNDGDGVTSNSDPAILVTHVTAFDNYNRVDTNPGSNFAVYGASSPSYEGLDAVITQVLSWRSNPLGARNDRLEPRSPASGFVWRNYHPDREHGIYDANNGKDSAVLVMFPNDEHPNGVKNRQLSGRSVSTLYIGGKGGQSTWTFGAAFANEWDIEEGILVRRNFSATRINQNNTSVNMYFNTGRVLTEDDFVQDPKELFAYGTMNRQTRVFENFRRGLYYGGDSQDASNFVSPFGFPGDMPYRRLDGSTPGSASGGNPSSGLANRADGRIHGDFLEIWCEQTAPSAYFIGLPKLGNFMRLKPESFSGVDMPGAHGLWN